MLYIPGGFAHGYQTLEKDTEVYYQVGQFYAPEYERGIRWNDPILNITWPETKSLILSEKDKVWSDFVLEKVDEPT
jgi:dTDP-4-dehydrorhamnose 3,5-epimerase